MRSFRFSFPDQIVVRLFLAILGVVGTVWGGVTFPRFWYEAPVERIARYIIAGDPFSRQTLANQIPIVENMSLAVCRPAALRSAAILRLRILEDAVKAANIELSSYYRELDASIQKALSCSPADPFLWVVLSWLGMHKTPPSIDLNYLRMSYKTGPNEGWIALKRNPIALGIFEQLPADLAERSIEEFVGLVESTMYDEAASILIKISPPLRDQLIAKLGGTPANHRRAFAAALERQGSSLTVPGVDAQNRHPWN